MSSLNQCQFIGNLGADPEVKSFQNGGRVANLRIACTEKWKDKEGNPKEKTEWVSIAIFSEGLVTVAERYLRKGSKVFISGKLSTRKWQDQQGNDRYSTEVVLQGPQATLVMLDGANADQGGQGDGGGRGERKRGYDDDRGGRSNQRSGTSGQRGGGGGWGSGDAGAGTYDDLDDDIPFITPNSIW